MLIFLVHIYNSLFFLLTVALSLLPALTTFLINNQSAKRKLNISVASIAIVQDGTELREGREGGGTCSRNSTHCATAHHHSRQIGGEEEEEANSTEARTI